MTTPNYDNMPKYEDEYVTVVRAGHHGDKGFNPGKGSQVLIRLRDGHERLVLTDNLIGPYSIPSEPIAPVPGAAVSPPDAVGKPLEAWPGKSGPAPTPQSDAGKPVTLTEAAKPINPEPPRQEMPRQEMPRQEIPRQEPSRSAEIGRSGTETMKPRQMPPKPSKP